MTHWLNTKISRLSTDMRYEMLRWLADCLISVNSDDIFDAWCLADKGGKTSPWVVDRFSLGKPQ
jgi:hypothetical protein